MKLIFFSDIHGNKYTFDSFLKKLKEEGADRVYFLGDIFGYYYDQDYIIDRLQNDAIDCIMGNHEKYFLEILDSTATRNDLIERYGNSYSGIQDRISLTNIQFIRNMPQYKVFTADGLSFAIFHGSFNNYLEGRIYPDTIINDLGEFRDLDYIILGHTHHKMVKQVGRTTIINPGSLGQQRDGKGCSYLIIDTLRNRYEFKTIDYDIQKLLKDIDKYDNGNDRLKEVLLRNSDRK